MAKGLRDQQLIELKDTIKTLNTTIKDLKALLEDANKREAEHVKREQVLQEQIDYLTKKLFGRSREKRDEQIEGQMCLFNEPEAEKTKPDPAEEEFVTVEKHKRKKKTTMAEKFANLPVQKEYLEVNEDKRICDICGTKLERIGEEFVRREIEIIKPSVKIIEYYSINYGCHKCKAEAEPRTSSREGISIHTCSTEWLPPEQ